jgi:hypothetical protein
MLLYWGSKGHPTKAPEGLSYQYPEKEEMDGTYHPQLAKITSYNLS